MKGGKLEKGFDALSIYNYFKARQIFYKLAKKENAAAAYGLAIIYRRTDNPFHNLDSSIRYGALANYYYKQHRKNFSYKTFKVDSATIQLFCDTVAEFYLKRLEIKNQVHLYEDFLYRAWHLSPHIRNTALQLRDELVLQKIVALNQTDSTRDLLIQYPQLYLMKQAQLVFERQQYEQLTKTGTEKEYLSYLTRFPNSSQSSKALENLYTLYAASKNKEGLVHFVHAFPNFPQSADAWKLLFALSVKSYSNEELQSFLNTYPAFPFKNSILKEIELNNYVLLPVEVGDLQGFIDTTSKLVIAPQFDKVNPFCEGLALVNRGDSVFYINKENQNVFNRYFSDGYDFHYGIGAVQSNDKWFLMNRQGQTISPFYNEISELSNGAYVVKSNNLYGVLDKYGHVLIEPKFSKIGDFKNDLAYYEENGLYGFIDKEGRSVKSQYQWISDFNAYGIALMQSGNKYGLINRLNQIILEANYDQILPVDKNIFIVVKNGKYGFYSGKACFLSAVEYDFKKEKPAEYYTNGQILRFLKRDEQAFADGNGRISIDYGTYEDMSFAGNGLIRVKRKNKYGYVNRKLNLVIPYKYNEAEDFKDSLAIVKRKNKICIVDLSGTELMETTNSLSRLGHGYFKLETNEGLELLNNKGQTLFKGIREIKIREEGYFILYFNDTSIKVLKY